LKRPSDQIKLKQKSAGASTQMRESIKSGSESG